MSHCRFNRSVRKQSAPTRRGSEYKSLIQARIGFFVKMNTNAKVAQLVEHDLAKVGVASSNLVFRSEIPPIPEGFFIYI